MSPTFAEFRESAAAQLSERLRLNHAAAGREADHLGRSVLELDGAGLLERDGLPLSSSERQELERLLSRRLQGTPLAQVLGTAAFMDLELLCTEATLAPRPETEILAEAALELLPEDSGAKIADLGCGTGAIAAAIAAKRRSVAIEAYERSEAAAKVAEGNFLELDLADRIRLVNADWSEATGPYQLIVSNPPYVSSAVCDRLLAGGDLADPREALDGGKDGMSCLRQVVGVAAKQLAPGGDLLLEHGLGQHHALVRLIEGAGLTPEARLRDLQGISRILHAKRSC